MSDTITITDISTEWGCSLTAARRRVKRANLPYTGNRPKLYSVEDIEKLGPPDAENRIVDGYCGACGGKKSQPSDPCLCQFKRYCLQCNKDLEWRIAKEPRCSWCGSTEFKWVK